MDFKIWLESIDAPKFASWNSYGDLVVYVGRVKYTYYTRNSAIAQRAYKAGQWNPWKTLEGLKKAGYEFQKTNPVGSQLSLF